MENILEETFGMAFQRYLSKKNIKGPDVERLLMKNKATAYRIIQDLPEKTSSWANICTILYESGADTATIRRMRGLWVAAQFRETEEMPVIEKVKL